MLSDVILQGGSEGLSLHEEVLTVTGLVPSVVDLEAFASFSICRE